MKPDSTHSSSLHGQVTKEVQYEKVPNHLSNYETLNLYAIYPKTAKSIIAPIYNAKPNYRFINSLTSSIPLCLDTVKPVEVQPRSRTTILRAITRACKTALAIRDIHTRRRPRIAPDVERIVTPTFASIFHTCVSVHPASGQTKLDRHAGAVVEDLVREQTVR